MQRLVLFDIDGTLLDTAGASGRALVRAFTELYSIDQPVRLQLHGRTDRGIIQQLFDGHQIENSQHHFERLCQQYLSHLPEALANTLGHLKPGVVELLAKLQMHKNVAIGLLTGNLQVAAFLKVERYGIGSYFRWGFFGDHHAHRADLGLHVGDTIHKSNQKHSGHHSSEAVSTIESLSQPFDRLCDIPQSVVIGDTVLDVQCARAAGMRCLAVETGGFSQVELAVENPDRIVPDLSDTDDLLDWIVNA